jgi:hypothetical protein
MGRVMLHYPEADLGGIRRALVPGLRFCVDCHQLSGRTARGLCHVCYARHRRAGTLARFPLRHPPHRR